MDKLINIYVKDTKNSIFKDLRRSPAAITEYYCTQESCELRDKGQCINIGFMQKCIHGYVSEKKGPGPRAKSYNKFISDATSHPLYNVLHDPPKKMAIINDYIWLPYAHVAMNKNLPFYRHDLYLVSGLPFLELAHFTPRACLDIITFRPMAMLGGEITSYQKDVVPKFLIDLQSTFPILFNDLIKLDATIKTRYPDLFNGSFKKYIGKTAILKTCSPFKYINTDGNTKWEWTGKVLKFPCKTWILASLNGYHDMYAETVPDDNCIFKITNETQVNEKTVFID